jgi:hypothetical protein
VKSLLGLRSTEVQNVQDSNGLPPRLDTPTPTREPEESGGIAPLRLKINVEREMWDDDDYVTPVDGTQTYFSVAHMSTSFSCANQW